VSKPTTAHLADLLATRHEDWDDDQRCLIADATGGVLIDDVDRVSPRKNLTRIGHRCREIGGFLIGHPIQDDSHKESAGLVVGDTRRCNARYDKIDFIRGQGKPIPLLSDDVNHAHNISIPTKFRDLKRKATETGRGTDKGEIRLLASTVTLVCQVGCANQ
jgi:hypothetical protein